MSVAFIEPLVEMTATLNVVVLINSTTVMHTYWTASCRLTHVATPNIINLSPLFKNFKIK